jgi:uncharacterized lipoprotein YmbA
MKRIALPLCGAIGAFLAACNMVQPPQADAVRYYVLGGPSPSGAPAQAPATGLRVGLKNVELAGYLKTLSIAVRRGPNEIVLNDYARWAESLDAAISRMLRGGLEASPAVARVFQQPFPFDADRDCDLSVRILRCEGALEPNGRAVARFAAEIEVTSAGPNPRLIARKEFTAPELPWDGRDYSRLASLISDDVAALAREASALLPGP